MNLVNCTPVYLSNATQQHVIQPLNGVKSQCGITKRGPSDHKNEFVAGLDGESSNSP